MARMGITIMEVTADIAVGTMPVAGNTQPYGLLHGGASAVLAESLGSLAAMAHAAPDGIAVGIDLSITHMRSARTGVVTGTATPLHRGRTIAVYAITIENQEGQIVSHARLTCAIRPAGAT
ncbi:PaaI family thioesterase [Demequina sp.]|uniref:PaaI family thioesterase n=1 Tax=Demequina sp. TaxID=2050685 RepID=UPI003457F1DA